MVANGLLPTLLVFGIFPKFSGLTRTNVNRKEIFDALKLARDEMEIIVAESRLKRALLSKLPEATKYLILPGDLVRVFRERSGRWEYPFTVTLVSKKIMSETDGIKIKLFNISFVLPIAPKTNTADLENDMETLQAFVLQYQQLLYPVEDLKPSDPQTTSTKRKEAIVHEISGLLAKGGFEYIKRSKIPP